MFAVCSAAAEARGKCASEVTRYGVPEKRTPDLITRRSVVEQKTQAELARIVMLAMSPLPHRY
jgi:hypothetical protein